MISHASSLFEYLESIFFIIVNYSILLMEAIGVAIIVVTVFRVFSAIIHHKQRNLRLLLAHGIAFALEFKLGAEVLRTILARSFEEIGMIACVIALRAALTFLLHWEVREEREEDENGQNEEDISVIRPKAAKAREKS